MRIYNCNQNETWDYISYLIFNDEFQMDLLLENNDYYYSDCLSFDLGDSIVIPDDVVLEQAIIKAPWEV